MSKIKFQVALYDKSTGLFSEANGNGGSAKVWETYEEAVADIQSWSRMFTRTNPNLRLGVQRIDYSLMTGSLVRTDGQPVELTDEEIAERGCWEI